MLMKLAWIEARRQPLALIALAILTGLGTAILSALALAGTFAGNAPNNCSMALQQNKYWSYSPSNLPTKVR